MVFLIHVAASEKWAQYTYAILTCIAYTTHYTLITISKNKILHFSFSSPHRTDFPLLKQRQMIFFSVSLIYFCSLFFLNSLFLMLVIEIHDICLKMNCFHEIPIQLPVIALKVEIKRLTIHGRKRVKYNILRPKVAANADTRTNI